MAFANRKLTREQVFDLLKTYGSPLYVYDEDTLRLRCREMKSLIKYENFYSSYSAKANTNIELLKIIRSEGLRVDAVSPGEIHLEKIAGFSPEEIMFVGNNVSEAEMQYVVAKGIYISVDSLDQLDTLGQINPDGEVCLRINTGIGAGFDDKVVTAGEHTKFGILPEELNEARTIAARYGLKITGLNHHIGSLFLESDEYLDGADRLLELAATFDELEIINLGGGFGIPYNREISSRLDLEALSTELTKKVLDWIKNHYPVRFITEPGRYVVAECGLLLATVTATKQQHGVDYIGCDAGFNTLIRPAFYDAYHEIEIMPKTEESSFSTKKPATLVGPICESGDILAENRLLPPAQKGDAVIIYDAGAYGYAMSSTYNSRPRPAEILIMNNGETRLIRAAETIADLYR